VPRAVIRLAVVLVVLLVLVVVADRVSVRVAERSVATRLTASERLPAPATVRFADLPFLTQALRGSYGTVRVTLRGLTTSGLVVDRIDATLHGVTAPADAVLRGGLSALPVQRGEATAFVSFASLAVSARRVAGVGTTQVALGRAAADRIAVTATVPVVVGTMTVHGQARVTVVGGVVRARLVPETLTGVPSVLRGQVARLVDLSAMVPPLPFGFRATSVRVDADGLRLTADGTRLSLPV